MNKSRIQAIFQHRCTMPLKGVGLFLVWYYFAAGLVFLAGGLYLLFFTRSGFEFWIWVLAAAHIVLGIWAVSSDRNSRLCARMMLEALENGGRELAWVYRVNQVLPGGGFQSILFTFWFTNRRHDSINLEEHEIEGMLDFFRTLSAQISVGYSKELDERNRKNPNDLKTHPERTYGVAVINVDPAQANGW